jgi:hypothetical protein
VSRAAGDSNFKRQCHEILTYDFSTSKHPQHTSTITSKIFFILVSNLRRYLEILVIF